MSGLANCGYCGNTASCVGKDNCIAAGCCHMTAYGAYTPVWAYANKSLNAFFCACQKSKPGFHMGQQTAIIPNELCP